MLETEGVVAGYTEELDILHGIDMHVEQDETICIIGPNGAGKSTLIKTIFGLLDPREGRVVFQGEDISGLDPNEIVAKGMCYVPQLDNVFPSLTVMENLELGAWVSEDRLDHALASVFDLFPILEERSDQRVGTMSGGQRQMVAMGRAMMSDPALILMDEPSAGLAPTLVDDVFENIRTIASTGTPIVLVEQNATKGLAIADRGYVLDTGEVRFEGTGQELLEDPQVGQLYLGG